ncbi:hypothetical protein H311_04897, partial [Anncaliia algerae PRA109]
MFLVYFLRRFHSRIKKLCFLGLVPSSISFASFLRSEVVLVWLVIAASFVLVVSVVFDSRSKEGFLTDSWLPSTAGFEETCSSFCGDDTSEHKKIEAVLLCYFPPGL